MKKNWLIISFLIVLFSLINIGLAQAGCVTIRVQYNDGCPRSNSDVTYGPHGDDYYFGITGEDGTVTKCSVVNPGDYMFIAWHSSIQFGDVGVHVDGDGNGSGTITKWGSTYPQGTESCGDTECDGLKYCYSGNPPYVECDSWNTECDTKKCCQCDGGTETEPTEYYDANRYSNCPIVDCDSLDITCRDYSDIQYCKALDECADANEDCNIFTNANSGTVCDDEFGHAARCDVATTSGCDGSRGECDGSGTCQEVDYDTACSGVDCGTCCVCDSAIANPALEQDGDCNPFDIEGISTCFNDPDAYDFTWDYREAFDSECLDVDTCSQGDDTITYTCNQPTCGAECDEDIDCGNKCIGDVRYYSGNCDLASTCTCSYSTENCDNQDACYAYGTGCEDRNYYCSETPSVDCYYAYSNRNTDYYDSFVNYCSSDTVRKHRRFHNFYCNGICADHTSWQDDQLVESCDASDGWYDTGSTKWISSGECTEKEQKEQEYKDYYCSETPSVDCYYSVTSTRWIDTGNTRNKPDGTACNDGDPNTINDQCKSGVCQGEYVSCTCGPWINTRTCCEGWRWPANKYIRTCNPAGCDTEYKCVRTWFCRR